MQPSSVSMLRMRRARAGLVADQPFYGVVGLQLRLVEDAKCKTIWTDGVSLGFNPRFVRDCSDSELKAVWCKEVLHTALKHPWRCAGRNLSLWGEACDYAIASLIEEARYQLPGTYRSNPEFAGWCAEAIYRKLKEKNQPPSPPPDAAPQAAEQSSGGEPGESGEQGDDGQPGDEDGDASEGEGADEPNSWRNAPIGELRPAPAGEDAKDQEAAVAAAVEQAQAAQGDLPGQLSIAIRRANNAKLNWKEQLWHFVQRAFVATDYTWSRPNARYLSTGLYIPSLQGHRTPRMAGAVDVSGSIVAVPSLVNQFIAELDAIVAECQPEVFDVLYVDAAVQQHEQYLPGDTIEPKHLPGGGGTSFVPAFEWVEEQDDEPCCMVYLTDLEGTFPAKEPAYPVLWVVPDTTGKLIANPPRVPFGEVVVLPAFD